MRQEYDPIGMLKHLELERLGQNEMELHRRGKLPPENWEGIIFRV